MAGVDHPQAGDAIDILVAVDVYENAAVRMIEYAQSVLLGQSHPFRSVNPNVFQSVFFECGSIDAGTGDVAH